MIEDSEAVLKILNQLDALGVGIAMDDFGTGYSNLSYLREFPFSNIKIDKSFVKDIEDAECRAIVHATVELSANLGISITAEGVETAQQVAILEAEGCKSLQGYYIGKPLPAARVLDTLEHFGDGRARQSLRRTA
jgi:EAL domain-containing protein (putative c-di-GMP-specific phosphodiesterase class I)